VQKKAGKKQPVARNPSVYATAVAKLRAHNTSEVERLKILEKYHVHDMSYAQIARLTGRDEKTVALWVKRGHFENVPKSGRPRTTLTIECLAATDEIAVEHAMNNKALTGVVWRAKLKKRGHNVSARSLREAKNQLGLMTVKARLKPERAYYKVNRDRRVSCARERQKLTADQLRRIIWIDESEGQIQPIREFVVRKPAKGKTREPVFVENVDGKEEKVHFLIAIGNGWKSKFEHLPVRRPVDRDDEGKSIPRTKARGRRAKGNADNKKLNQPNEGKTWNGDTLTPIFEKWLQSPKFKSCYGVVLDNARPHSKIRELLEKHHINVLEHPPHSPDMNIIEHVHQTVKQRARSHAATNNKELLAAYEAEWAKYSPEEFQEVQVSKYPAILQAVITNKGFPTKF
jgi:transposase